MPTKTAQTNGSRGRTPARKTADAKKPRRPDPRYWKRAFGRNLIQNGYSPAEAKEIVELFAS